MENRVLCCFTLEAANLPERYTSIHKELNAKNMYAWMGIERLQLHGNLSAQENINRDQQGEAIWVICSTKIRITEPLHYSEELN